MLGMEGVISLSERHSLPHEVTTRFYHINVYKLLILLIINHLDTIVRVSRPLRQILTQVVDLQDVFWGKDILSHILYHIRL